MKACGVTCGRAGGGGGGLETRSGTCPEEIAWDRPVYGAYPERPAFTREPFTHTKASTHEDIKGLTCGRVGVGSGGVEQGEFDLSIPLYFLRIYLPPSRALSLSFSPSLPLSLAHLLRAC